MNIKKKVRLVLRHNNKEIPIAKQIEALDKIKMPYHRRERVI